MNNNFVSFDSLLETKSGKAIILRFSWNTCEDCQVQEMKLLEKIGSIENIMVIVSYKTFRYFRLYMKAYNFALQAYYLDGTETMLEDEKSLSKVFSFITDKSFNISLVHIGNVGFPFLSEAYYKLASHKLKEHVTGLH